MRVLLVSQRMLPYLAGAETKIFHLARCFIKEGVQASIVTTKFAPGLPQAEIMEGVPVRRLTVLRTIQESGLWHLASKISQLVAMAVYVGVYGRNYDAVHAECASASALGAVLGGCLSGLPLVLEPSLAGPDGEIQKLLDSPARAFLLKLLKQVDLFAANSGSVTNELAALGVPADRIAPVKNVVDLEQFRAPNPGEREELRRRFGLPDGPVALFVGQLVARKGVRELLAAWEQVYASIPDALLILAGAGDEAENVNRAASRSDARIRYVGSRNDIADWMRASDLLVLPSRNESFGNVIIEAMACGLPVVTGNTGIAFSLPIDGLAGRVVDVTDPLAISSALLDIFSLPDRGKALGEQGQLLIKPYDLRSVAHDYLALYRTMLDKKK